jgi:hypothetical protein
VCAGLWRCGARIFGLRPGAPPSEAFYLFTLVSESLTHGPQQKEGGGTFKQGSAALLTL